MTVIPDTLEPTYSFNSIIFPKVYEDAWASADGGTAYRTDLERARIFLLRMAKMNPGPMMFPEIRAIVMDARNTTVPALAIAIQSRVFGNRHMSFSTNQLVQIVRFMLIKSNVACGMFSDRAKSVIDFFFDPTIERNLKPEPSGETVRHDYPAGRLRVVIVGGGPTALAAAISLAEKGAGKVEIHMYERRWVQRKTADGSVAVDYPPTARRRDQVSQLQRNPIQDELFS